MPDRPTPPLKPSPGPNGAAEDQGEAAESFISRLRRLVMENFRDRPMLAWLVVAALVLVLWLRVLTPLSKQVDELEAETKNLEKSLASYQRTLAKQQGALEKVQKRQQQLQAKAAGLKTRDPAKAGESLKKAVEERAKKAGLEVTDIRKMGALKKGKLIRVAVKMSARGSFNQVSGFLSSFKKGPGFMHVYRYELSRQPNQGKDALKLQCEAADLVKP